MLTVVTCVTGEGVDTGDMCFWCVCADNGDMCFR